MNMLAKCRMYGVRHEDLRSRSGGGNLWVYTDPTSHPELVAELNRLGFRFAPKRGYWLEGKD